jgi:hypothetical protein
MTWASERIVFGKPNGNVRQISAEAGFKEQLSDRTANNFAGNSYTAANI